MINPAIPVINEASVPIKDGKKSIPFVIMTIIEATGATNKMLKPFMAKKMTKKIATMIPSMPIQLVLLNV